MRIDSSAPTRVDLAGGTLDIWPLYLFHDRAQTINAALTLRASCTLTSRRDHRIRLTSDDTGETVEAADPQALGVDRLGLVARLVRHFGARGVDVRTRSDSPVGAGIAGSSALNIALIGGLAAWTGRPLTDEDTLTLAMNIEAQVIAVPTGLQDYRPAYYGGIAAIDMGVSGVTRIALDVDPEELSRRLVVAYTGAPRQSGINNWDVMTRRINGDPAATSALDGICDATGRLRAALTADDWAGAADAITAEWTHRRQLAAGVTTAEIDRLLEAARGAGALAGKVCGAGGGGCLACLTEPDTRDAVAAALRAGGATVLDCAVDPRGLIVERT